MKGIERVIWSPTPNPAAVNINSSLIPATGGTDQLITEIDLSTVPLAREFKLSGRLLNNATQAPGASKYAAINWYWSEYKISTLAPYTSLAASGVIPGALTAVPTILAQRKHTTGPILIDNAALVTTPAASLIGDRWFQVTPAITLPATTTTALTTTATAIFPGSAPLNVGDLVTVSGGTVGGNGNLMQGTYPVATIAFANGFTTITYTITSSTGTLTGATIQICNPRRAGGNDQVLTGIFRPLAQFLYVSIDTPSFTAGATLAASLNLIRVPSPFPPIDSY